MKWMIVLWLSIPLISFSQHAVSLLNTQLKTLENKAHVIESNSRIPFEVVRGMMHVEAELEGKKGRFIIDSGAPLLIINQKIEQGAAIQAYSISNSFSIDNIQVSNFNWAGLEYKNLEALALDLNHFSKASKKDIQGIIGYNTLQDYELFIDFEQQELSLLTNKDFSNRHLTEPHLSIPIVLHGHLPVIKVEIGGKVLHFGLDTGAAVNMIDAELFEEISDFWVTKVKWEEVQGVDQSIQKVKAAKIKGFSISEQELNPMKFLTTDFSYINADTDLQIDGLLGYPFFKQLKCSINYQNETLFIWEILELSAQKAISYSN